MAKETQSTPAPATPAAATPTPAATPAPAVAAPAAEPTDITDALRGENAMAALLTTPKKVKKAKETPAEPVTPPAPATPEPAAVTPPAPATPAAPPVPVKVRKPAPRQPSLTAQEVADIAAQTAARMQPPAVVTPPPAAFELPPELKDREQVYAELAKSNPAKYKDIGRRQAEFLKKELDYAVQWEDSERQRLIAAGDSNTQPVYDANDARHSKFYERNQPDIDARDLHRAEIRVEARNEIEQSINPKIKEQEETIRNLRAGPSAQQAVGEFGASFISALNPDQEITRESVMKWRAENPFEAEASDEVNDEVRPVVHAASLLWDGAVKLDENDYAHTTAAAAFNGFEQTLSNQPEPLENEQGQTWIPLAQYKNLPKAQRSQHFTTTKEAFVRFIGLNAAEKVKNLAAQRRGYAEKYAARAGYVKANPSPVTGQPAAAPVSTPAPALQSPSVSAGAPTAPSSGVAPAPVVASTDRLGDMLGRR